jgi:hypothetical protein
MTKLNEKYKLCMSAKYTKLQNFGPCQSIFTLNNSSVSVSTQKWNHTGDDCAKKNAL